MRAAVRSVSDVDSLVDLASNRAVAEVLHLRFLIGPSDGPGEESFDVTICTPAWLNGELREQGRPILGRHLVIVDQIRPAADVSYVRDKFEHLQGVDWADLSLRMARIGYWEFEDYQE